MTEQQENPGTAPTLAEVVESIDALWPFSLTEEWDRTGVVVGRMDKPVRSVLVAVDPVADVVTQAIEGGFDLLVTHHPLLLKGVNSVSDETAKGEMVMRLAEAGCALVCTHTNADQPEGGVSQILADILGLTEQRPLAPAKNGPDAAGIGRVGVLAEPVSLASFAQRVARSLPRVAGGVRVAGDLQAEVRTVAVCGGAGDSLFDDVRASGADVYVTSDLRHHPASEARETARGGTPFLIDTAH
ncbi:Nif3-like dinuclear metal center hexameric protein, partial [Micrococcus sp.]|uniref:Nif3-like dinuclear metal center hexameric protein n=1 Tax=Micrococcus sp. TaxID=1271 RepID=UPI0026DCC02B